MMFTLIMLIAVTVTGIVWLLDIAYLRKARPEGAAESWVVEYSKSFFPVILAVFLIRSFLVEPFKIPSGSMMPTLLTGDFILVNKFTYGLRVPLLNSTFIEVNHPQRGEVMVFRYPVDESQNYIKRVVGLPGDRIRIEGHQVTINGQPLDATFEHDYEYIAEGLNIIVTKRYKEKLGEHVHDILWEDVAVEKNGEIIVPEGHYFMMGDNRDHSSDSRFWGLVPEKNIIGKAFMIWWNFDNFGRIGNSIH
ncbi:MAG: signal peptidase I [Methylobacillus sp.]|jgi:signal peptidase I|nr:signal peptidase I [Methylobacillus sp.]